MTLSLFIHFPSLHEEISCEFRDHNEAIQIPVLESIVLGVPMIAWPLFAEQKMNAVLLCDDVNVAMRLKFNEDGLVERDEIAKVVKGLMEDDGNGIRGRIEELRDDAVEALKDDGSSTRAICQFGNTLESFVNNI
ncbi:hypothetical protein TSUD_174400 [Trifolium subterraneum]|uniref:Uncharacterized protein n=1 Tax=Trifolium subterraneum TaxID=3900 RepID=A0A2Z6NPM4_TRISU|nr:hypothetical protein TSUD_174400 [Trifolium subterraneum]